MVNKGLAYIIAYAGRVKDKQNYVVWQLGLAFQEDSISDFINLLGYMLTHFQKIEIKRYHIIYQNILSNCLNTMVAFSS